MYAISFLWSPQALGTFPRATVGILKVCSCPEVPLPQHAEAGSGPWPRAAGGLVVMRMGLCHATAMAGLQISLL